MIFIEGKFCFWQTKIFWTFCIEHIGVGGHRKNFSKGGYDFKVVKHNLIILIIYMQSKKKSSKFCPQNEILCTFFHSVKTNVTIFCRLGLCLLSHEYVSILKAFIIKGLLIWWWTNWLLIDINLYFFRISRFVNYEICFHYFVINIINLKVKSPSLCPHILQMSSNIHLQMYSTLMKARELILF